MTARKKWLLIPGWVRSKHDGDEHYIDAGELARLYGVPLFECIVTNRDFARMGYGLTARQAGLPRLEPRYNGDYTLPAPAASPPPGTEENDG